MPFSAVLENVEGLSTIALASARGPDMLENFRESITSLIRACNSSDTLGNDFLASAVVYSRGGSGFEHGDGDAEGRNGRRRSVCAPALAQSTVVANLLEVEPPPMGRNIRVDSASTPIQKRKAKMYRKFAASAREQSTSLKSECDSDDDEFEQKWCQPGQR